MKSHAKHLRNLCLICATIAGTPSINAQSSPETIIVPPAPGVTRQAELDSRLEALAKVSGQLPQIQALLTEGADPLAGKHKGGCPLFTAILSGRADYVNAMLSARPGLCATPWPSEYVPTTTGMAALYMALKAGSPELALHLLKEENVKISSWRPDFYLTTKSALGLAVENWDTEVVRLLISKGATYQTSDEGFFTLLDAYGRSREFDGKDSPLRQAARFDEEMKNLRAQIEAAPTPARRQSLEKQLRFKEAVHQRQLSETQSRPNTFEKIKRLASFRDPRSPNVAVGINDSRSDRATPLAIATANNWPEIVALLIAAGADPDRGSIDGRTPAELAATNPEMLRAMNGNTANAPSATKTDGAAYVAAITRGDAVWLAANPPSDAILSFRDANNWTALHHAIKNANDDTALRLIEAGAALDIPSVGGQTPLTFAGFLARPVVARALLAKHVHLNAPTTPNGTPPLIGACAGGDTSIVKMLLEAGANPNVTFNGGVPLICNAIFTANNSEVVRMLIDAGVNLDVTDPMGLGPLELCFEKDREKTLELLLDRQAKWHGARDTESSPLLMAVQARAWRCAKLLLRRGERDERALTLATDPEFRAALENIMQSAGSKAFDNAELWPAICADDQNWKSRMDEHLRKGGDINYRAGTWTPLLLAIKSGSIEKVRYFVTKGADPKVHVLHPMLRGYYTLHHLYVENICLSGMKTADPLAYRNQMIRLLAPLEPSPEYERRLFSALREKQWSEAEAYVAAGVPTQKTKDRLRELQSLSPDDATKAATILDASKSRDQ